MSTSPISHAALLYPRSTGLYWNSSDGLPVSLIYALPERTLFPNPYEIILSGNLSLVLPGPTANGLRIIETAASGQEAAIRDPIWGISKSISDIANVSLSPLNPTTSAELSQAHIRLWNYNQGALSLAGGPQFPAAFTYDVRELPSGLLLHEDIFVDPTRLGSTFNATSIPYGGSLYYALLHECLHALGLKHPDPVPGDPTSFPPHLSDPYASLIYTVMRSSPLPLEAAFLRNGQALVTTPMLLDVAALQAVYGANRSTRAGNDDVYVFSDVKLQYATIWDAGGMNDRISAENQRVGARIDLRPGGLSTISPYATGFNIAIAYNPSSSDGFFDNNYIENATGSIHSDVITGNATSNVLEGRAGNDTISGLEGSDRLEGGDGDDTLVGGQGDDVLAGGTGNDVYVWSVGDGDDRIVEEPDADGVVRGRIIHHGTGYELNVLGAFVPVQGAANTWELPGTEIVLTHSSPWSLNMPGGGTIDLGDGFEIGDFGIQVIDVLPGVPSPAREFMGDLRPLGSHFEVDPVTGAIVLVAPDSLLYDEFGNVIGDPNLLAENQTDVFHGSPGSDGIYGEGGGDHLFGEGGDDLIFGGDGIDYIEGGIGNDVIAGLETASPGDMFADVLHGGEGNDQIFAGAILSLDEAVLMEGTTIWDNGGGSSLYGEEGDDVLVGSSHSDFMSGGPGNDLLMGGRHWDLLHGDDGDDILYAGVDGANMAGGLGNDTLSSNEGALRGSLLYGGTSGYDPQDGNDVLIGNKFTDYIQGGGGSDLVFAGDGNDTFEDDFWTYYAADQIYMGGGGDYVSASHGDDLIDGGDGNDTLVGHGGNDRIFGGSGNDVLDGGWQRQAATGPGNGGPLEYVDIASGNDSLYGEDGDDRLVGGEGDDYLVGGRGSDLLEGGPGGDAYVFNVGDGLDTINDFDQGLPGQDTLYFGSGITPDNITLLATPIDRRLFVLFDNPLDRIVIPQWFVGDRFRIESFGFADGTTWGIAEIESNAGSDGPSIANDLLVGTNGNDLIHGLEGDDEIADASGNDILFGDEGRDLIIDSEGHNLLIGGTGRDFLRLNGAPIYDESGEEEIGLVGGSPGSFAMGGQDGDGVLIDDHSVVAYNAGDGEDGIRWTTGNVQKLAISLGGGLSTDDLYLSHLGFRFLLNVGPEIIPEDEEEIVTQPGISLPNLLAQPSLWPAITLQIIGQDVRSYDFNAVVQTYLDELAADPDLTYWSAAQALQANLIEVSTTHALGGAIAYQYGTTGSVDALTAAQIRAVLGDVAFGIAAQEIEASAENSAPVLGSPIADQSTNEDTACSFVVPAGTFGDPDAGDELEYTATLADGSALPAWLAFDAETQTFSGTPLQSDVGALEVVITATDTGGLSAADTFTLTVVNVNDAPMVANPLADLSFEAGAAFSFTVPQGTFADEDPGDTLALSAARFDSSSLPSWLSFDPATAVFTGNPAVTDYGISHILVTAVDGAGAAAQSDFGLVLRVPAGTEATGSAGDDVIYGGTGDETLTARGGSDYLYGDAGSDLLKGGGGNDVLQGGAGNDVLRGGKGQNVLDGGIGDDLIFGGAGSAFILGGAGNDTLRVGSGNDVIAFNAGDGLDTVYGGRDGGNTLSFGGGIRYSDLALSKVGKDLVVSTGAGEGVTLKNWYAGNHSVLNLQIVLDATEEFDAGSADPLYNRRVQTFDFLGMVSAYDAARVETPGLTSWEITNALLAFHLSGADDMALGGDLAYWYGKNRTLAGISLQSAQQVIGAANFGSEAQSLRPFNGLQEGFVKLA